MHVLNIGLLSFSLSFSPCPAFYTTSTIAFKSYIPQTFSERILFLLVSLLFIHNWMLAFNSLNILIQFATDISSLLVLYTDPNSGEYSAF